MRHALECFVGGDARSQHEELAAWIGGLRLLRCVERATEAGTSSPLNLHQQAVQVFVQTCFVMAPPTVYMVSIFNFKFVAVTPPIF